MAKCEGTSLWNLLQKKSFIFRKAMTIRCIHEHFSEKLPMTCWKYVVREELSEVL